MLSPALVVGERVVVPFGPRKVVGIVLGLSDSTEQDETKLKPITSRVTDKYHFDLPLLKFLTTSANYYHHPIGDVCQMALPVALRKIEQPDITPELEYFSPDKVDEDTLANILKRSPKQAKLLQTLTESQGVTWPELRTLGFSKTQLNGLEKKELVENRPRKTTKYSYSEDNINQTDKHKLSAEQASIVAGINQTANQFACHLIEGVTGSGKTEVYLQAIEQTLANNQQVLILVPEIGLTPQTLSRFEKRFNVPIHLHHSGLNDKEKLSTWLSAQTGSAAIIIGTRSAIFSPLKQLGLIIIDEEHDASFKQQDSFRYHGRDLAIMRAKQLNIPIVLGSATPSFESLQNALAGKYIHHQLTKRAGNATKSQIKLIAMQQQQVTQGLSGTLIAEIKQTLARKEQVLLFINRRGFAPAINCQECHWVAECGRCNHPFTLHKKQQLLICHHCGNQQRVVKQCHNCGSVRIDTVGQGTEKLEEQISELFPDASTVRIDRDSTRRKGELAKLLDEVNDNKHQLLIGTQMLAKGHHFPNVTLVAVLEADGALFSYDFRATENLAQLLVQVAGRAGRASKPGKVFIQTEFPEHPLLQDLVNNGYEHFARYALTERSQAMLPPFCHQVLIRAEANYPSYPEQFLRWLSEVPLEHSIFAGPMPAPMEKKAGKYRYHLMLQSTNRKALHQGIMQLLAAAEQIELSKKVRWTVDIDPHELTW